MLFARFFFYYNIKQGTIVYIFFFSVWKFKKAYFYVNFNIEKIYFILNWEGEASKMYLESI